MKKQNLTYEVGNDMIFVINKDEGIVVCKLSNCSEIARNRIWKYTQKLFQYPDVDYIIKDEYVGVAKCAPEDKFDLEYGKKLALSRAKQKRSKAVNSAIVDFINAQKHSIKELERFGIRSRGKVIRKEF